MSKIPLSFLISFCVFTSILHAQIVTKPLHYVNLGQTGFRCVQPKQKFNRALYGGNTAFRVEAGDFPEFALYLPGMGGNCKIGIINDKQSKWISEAKTIQTVYQDGAMKYEIQDEILGKATLFVNVTAAYTAEAMLLSYRCEGILPKGVQLVLLYGGITGKKFSRDGDIGADPESSFYLKPENCANNQVLIHQNKTEIRYNPKDSSQVISSIFPPTFLIQISDASAQKTPLASVESAKNRVEHPCVLAKTPLQQGTQLIYIGKGKTDLSYQALVDFEKKNAVLRQKQYSTLKILTPDSLLNPLGQALSLAADAIWDSPTYMHGAVAWRMRLPAWRGPYIADVLGQHDRAKTHFSAYAKSQVSQDFPLTTAMPDSEMHYAREVEKIGSGIFTEGYICRNPNGDMKAHHYDMNLVYIDQLINHFNWTGDTAYLRQMYPVIEKHLAWEKHNFDSDNDGLFDAYCCIWASDALQYSGGGVTHSTAYNYKAFKAAAYFAKVLGKDPIAYQHEADKIYTALQKHLWLNETGCFAEYKDALGLKLVHPSAALWTVYHAIDSDAASPAQQYSMTKYVEKNIPHIPFKIPQLKDDFYLLSTTNWLPYTWSINNVALAENLHTALACWQANNAQMGFDIWRNSLLETLYTSASPGGFEQLSSFDAARGELYRDFADGVGMAGRSLVEGLFGIQPQLLSQQIVIKQGFPKSWNFARLKTIDISFDFKRNNEKYQYQIETFWQQENSITLKIPSDYAEAKQVKVNGKNVAFHFITDASGTSVLEFTTPKGRAFTVNVVFGKKAVKTYIPEITVSKPPENKPVLVQKGENKSEMIDLTSVFNDKITNIFKNKYLSPRPTSPTLQLPSQGIGNWCYPLTHTDIDDSGLRKIALQNQGKITHKGITFTVPTDSTKHNIAFVSKWDNFPDTLTITPKNTQGNTLHLLMAGTTNPMQSRMENGKVVVTFENGETRTLSLQNPDTWWSIEQDYAYDGKAFYYDIQKKPTRLLLKTGEFTSEKMNYSSIKGFSNTAIEGGAANVYEMPIPNVPIKSIKVIALCNDVIIGLMALTVEE
jgi:hypothetical protein